MARSTKTSWKGKLLLALGSILVALVLAEALFRLLSGEKVALQGLYSEQDVVGIGLTPGFEGSMRTSEFEYRVSINELGMRDHPVPPKKPAVSRILVLGDSFVFGVGVDLEESLPKVLETQLGSDGLAVEVLNAGVPGYSTFHELHALRRLGPVVAPDLVVLVFFIGDDWYGNVPRRPPEEARKDLPEWLRNHSGLYRFLDRFILGRLKNRAQYDIHRIEATDGFLQRQETVLTLLEEIRNVAADHGAELLVVLNPRYTQVYEYAWKKAALVYRLSDDVFSRDEPNRTFRRALLKRGFRSVDLLHPLQAEGELQQLHFTLDGHWTEEGHKFVASLIADAIRPALKEVVHKLSPSENVEIR